MSLQNFETISVQLICSSDNKSPDAENSDYRKKLLKIMQDNGLQVNSTDTSNFSSSRKSKFLSKAKFTEIMVESACETMKKAKEKGVGNDNNKNKEYYLCKKTYSKWSSN